MFCSICGRSPECGGPVCAMDDGWRTYRTDYGRHMWTCPDCIDGMIRADRDDGR